MPSVGIRALVAVTLLGLCIAAPVRAQVNDDCASATARSSRSVASTTPS